MVLSLQKSMKHGWKKITHWIAILHHQLKVDFHISHMFFRVRETIIVFMLN
jgi:hypothetical protein